MFVERAFVDPVDHVDDWPFTVPAVADLVGDGLEFHAPVTMLVGDNGSGKSTIVEAVAEGFDLDSRGGRASRLPRTDTVRTPLGDVIELETTPRGARMLRGPRLQKKGFFLRAETAVELTERYSGVPGYWDEDTTELSHGEGFLAVFRAMFQDPGFYVLDEPESALSFTACLRLVALMSELADAGAQVVCATHSPVLASVPGADIVEVGDHGLRRTSWEELELVAHWRRYLADPSMYLRHLLD
ncbi:ABC transporter [Rhodococcus sp. RS1C4]|uniref:AAA family ATPase n=1 Tax=Nocardiaceae TaxID=85025 RepID=UPI000522E9DE|nr:MULTISPECIES: AAA family ATPase [Rhodococcus]OZC47763.1 ABC transporter [Rhodococcus sp. RS1C4]OZC61514.1 ABC transporter [Rhodococcus sp. 06-621-2]OZC81091.1 ABC transporter [Rhodococcus sp. 06-418-1B]OZD13295.1 ABC transporter [Rhodococcus sp. 06-156-4C]OZD16108.1 ABC transporter [Rhodococcus sp. 06-156-3C]